MMTSTNMNARKLRILLALVVALMVIGASLGFYFTQNQLRNYATNISVLRADGAAGDRNLQLYRSIEEKLDQESGAVEEAQDIVAQSQQYRYQNQIVSDLTRISRRAGVTITSFSFSDATTAAPGEAATVPAPAATPSPTPAPTPAASGLNSRTVNVAFESPLQYSSIMNFIRQIEQNKLKMQIASVSLSKAEGTMVSSDSFSIEVYVQ